MQYSSKPIFGGDEVQAYRGPVGLIRTVAVGLFTDRTDMEVYFAAGVNCRSWQWFRWYIQTAGTDLTSAAHPTSPRSDLLARTVARGFCAAFAP